MKGKKVSASKCMSRKGDTTDAWKLPACGQGESKRTILLPWRLPTPPPPQSLALHLAMGKKGETMLCLYACKRHLRTRSIHVLLRSKGTRSREQVRTHSLKGGKWLVTRGNKRGPESLQVHAKGLKIERQVAIADAQVRRGRATVVVMQWTRAQ